VRREDYVGDFQLRGQSPTPSLDVFG